MSGARQMTLGDDSEVWDDVARSVRQREWSWLTGYAPTADAAPLATGSSDPRLVARASKYLAKLPGSVQGANGSGALFRAAQSLVRGFGLDLADSLKLLADEFNARCSPPWSASELRRAVRSAARRGQMAIGSLRDADRTRAA